MYFSKLEVVMEDVFLLGGGAAQPGQGPAQLAVPPRVRRTQETVGKASNSGLSGGYDAAESGADEIRLPAGDGALAHRGGVVHGRDVDVHQLGDGDGELLGR